MEKFEIKGTEITPSVDLNFTTGVFKIKGRSIPEDSFSFYQPLSLAIEEYIRAPKSSIQFNIQLEYYNSSSSACLLNIFKKLEKMKKETSITIFWHYEKEDEDTLLAGKNFESIIDISFKMVEVSSN